MLDEIRLIDNAIPMDFLTDQNPRAIYHVEATIGLPDYVKAAAPLTPEDVADLPGSAFADSTQRELPMHTKVATYLSAAYYLGTYRGDADVLDRLTKAAAFQDIEDDFNSLVQLFASTKAAAASSGARAETHDEFALSVNFGTEEAPVIENYYSLKSASAVEDASRDLHIDYRAGRIPLDWYYDAARAIVKKATVLGVATEYLNPAVAAAGTERLPDLDYAMSQIHTRKIAGVGEDDIALYEEIVKAAAAAPAEEVRQFASLWGDLDTRCGIVYDDMTPDPYQAFFSGPTQAYCEKLANEVVMVLDVPVPKDVLGLLPEEQVRQNFRKEAADCLMRAVTAAPTKPAEATQLMATLRESEARQALALLVNL